MIGLDVTFALLAGDVIATAGALPRLTVIVALPGPNELVQVTVMVLAPTARATELVLGVVDAVPLTVQVVPDGIVVAPPTVYATLIDVAVVFVLLAGEVMTTDGMLPKDTVIDALPGPNALVQVTVIVFAPLTRVTELLVPPVDAAPLTVQVVPDGIAVEPPTV